MYKFPNGSPEFVVSKVVNARRHVQELGEACPELKSFTRRADEMIAIEGNRAIVASLQKKYADEAQTLTEVAILERICVMCDLPNAA